MSSRRQFLVLRPNLQISLYSRLQSLRTVYLREGLKATVEDESFELPIVDAELSKLVSSKHLRRLASSGLRGEVFFPVPYLLKRNPFLLGYYRLLLGFSQKAFYSQGPFGAFKGLEDKGRLPASLSAGMQGLCRSLIQTAGLLLDGVEPATLDIVTDLQLLTLGPQLRGSRNVDLGQVAVDVVFNLLKGLLVRYSPTVRRRTITLTNDSALPVEIRFGGDPDVSVVMKLGEEDRKLVAMEIKGGTDVSNIWNRLGEAEKSHQSAKKAGFHELWTVTGVDVNASADTHTTALEKSPTTTQFFYLARIVDSTSPEGVRFRKFLGSLMGAQLYS